MPPERRRTLIAQVTDDLRAEIASGRWPIGSRIPTEPELCERTGTARNTVREAVQALVHTGMLERRQGSGTYVLAADEQTGSLAGYFSAARERDLLELREALEGTAAALAAARRDDADIAELRRLLARRNALWNVEGTIDPRAQRAAVAADTAMHRAIVAASHNEVYLEFYDTLIPVLARSLGARAVNVAESYAREHTSLVEAVVAGDVAAAEAAARGLIAEVLRHSP